MILVELTIWVRGLPPSDSQRASLRNDTYVYQIGMSTKLIKVFYLPDFINMQIVSASEEDIF